MAAGVQNSILATANATTEAVNTLCEEMRKKQAATANAITAMGGDVRSVVTMVDVIEEEVGAAKKLLEKTYLRVEMPREATQAHSKEDSTDGEGSGKKKCWSRIG